MRKRSTRKVAFNERSSKQTPGELNHRNGNNQAPNYGGEDAMSQQGRDGAAKVLL
jgi:hypothetical protein